MSKTRNYPRIPEDFNGIQVNHCKNPICENFLQPAANRLEGRQTRTKDKYSLAGGSSSTTVLKCKICGESTPVKSNKGIYEELNRIITESTIVQQIHCPVESCQNYGVRLQDAKKAYQSYGTTRSGSKRYKCKSCGKLFSIAKVATLRQKRTDINELIFRLLVNKMPMRRICETANIHPATLYSKINYIYKQCIKFSQHYEDKLYKSKVCERLYISSDKQDYVLNWGSQLDRRNVTLHAIGSADNITSYVFGMHLDIDTSLNSESIEKEALKMGDYNIPYPYRHFARLWLQRDYKDAYRIKKRIKKHRNMGTLEGKTAKYYKKMLDELDDQDHFDRLIVNEDIKRPAVGVQVRQEYTLYGHYFYLADLLRHIPKVRFYLDQEPGVRSAVMAAFGSRIRARQIEAFYVNIQKKLTIEDKKLFKAHAQKAINKLVEHNKGMSIEDAEIQLLIDALRMPGLEQLSTQWVNHPLPDMGEPQKRVFWLTPHTGYELKHLARLYRRASLRSIDRFFMLVRRRLSIFERPIATASNQKRTWNGYSAYNPEISVKMLNIFRVFYNYSLTGKDKSVPASRLGLIEKPASLKQILEFMDP